MALWRRDHTGRRVDEGLIHHSDAYDKALAETTIARPSIVSEPRIVVLDAADSEPMTATTKGARP
jgi:hypothetical protein